MPARSALPLPASLKRIAVIGPLADSGEDSVLICDSCGYAANAEKAEFVKPAGVEEPEREVGEVHTPGKKSIAEKIVSGSTRLSQQDTTMTSGLCPKLASSAYWSIFGPKWRNLKRR